MVDFIFITPLWLLAILPAVILATRLIRNRSKQGLIASHIATGLGLEQSRASHLPKLLLICWVFGCIALAGPSWQQQERPAFQLQSARVLVLDMSRSLYATDIKPNRLTQLKYKALDLLPKWQEGTTGLIAFAGDAYTLSPLTSDSKTLADLVQNLSPEIMPFQGGNLQAGIEQAIQLMKEAGHLQGDVIVLTDDIDANQLTALEDHLSSQSWRISVLAVGTQQGSPITQSDGTLLKDNSGVTVMATANLSGLQSLAHSTGGVFSTIRQDNQDVDTIAKFSTTSSSDIDRPNTNGEQLNTRINNGFWLLPFVLLPLLGLFRKGWLFSLALFMMPFIPGQRAIAAPLQNADQQGFELFQQQDYQQAAALFSDKEWRGVAHYQAGEYQQAIESLQGIETANAKYNLANALAQNGDLEQAKSAYQTLLNDTPDAADVKKNLEIVEQALAQQKQQQENQQQQDGNNSEQQNSEQPNSDQQNDKQQNDKQQGNKQSDQQQSSSGQPEQDQSSNGEQSPNEASSNQGKPDQDKSDESQPKDKQSQQQQSSKDTSQTPQQQDNEAVSKPSQEQSNRDENAKATSAPQDSDNTQHVDPNLRKLEQIQSQSDPSFLLKAQMLLQAQQKESPNKVNKSW